SSRRVAHSARENVRYGESLVSVRSSILCSGAASAARPRCLFLEPRPAHAARQRGLDLCEGNAARRENHEQVIEQIRRLADQSLAIFIDGRERGLDRLLAEFLRTVPDALVQ